MKLTGLKEAFLLMFLGVLITSGCSPGDADGKIEAGRQPVIRPDYSGVTVPYNIAPLNFIIEETAASFNTKAYSADGKEMATITSRGKISFSEKVWRKLTEKSRGGKIRIEIEGTRTDGNIVAFDPFFIEVVNERVDPYLCYRLLYPGYEAWLEMSIIQRSTENFSEYPVFENQLLNNNCVNCHSFVNNSPDKFMLHVRGSEGGTYFVNGRNVVKTAFQVKTKSANAVYPAWHPSGKYLSFSSNRTVQAFHTRPEKNIEVYDLFSSLIFYDLEKNEVMNCSYTDTAKYMETFPCWSPDGLSLYYCRAPEVKEDFDFRDVKYDLVKLDFNPETRSFSKPEIVFSASAIGKSVSFPSISPDGNYLIFTLHDYGTFSIWHKEADLYILDLKTGNTRRMDLNSDETESYHSWSSNGKWIVFSSKRMDGLSARPYIAFFKSPEQTGKPFVLPQKDPALYERMEKTFNRPEFITGKIKTDPRDFEKASKKEASKVSWKERR
jgi:dipeptidyl aminopeptidase/acylaminoacyl peptidase